MFDFRSKNWYVFNNEKSNKRKSVFKKPAGIAKVKCQQLQILIFLITPFRGAFLVWK